MYQAVRCIWLNIYPSKYTTRWWNSNYFSSCSNYTSTKIMKHSRSIISWDFSIEFFIVIYSILGILKRRFSTSLLRPSFQMLQSSEEIKIFRNQLIWSTFYLQWGQPRNLRKLFPIGDLSVKQPLSSSNVVHLHYITLDSIIFFVLTPSKRTNTFCLPPKEVILLTIS